MSMRKKKKKSKTTIRGMALIIGLVMVTGIVIGGTVFVWNRPPSFLRVQDVVIQGKLKAVSEVDLIRISDVKKGEPLLNMDLSAVREKILASPWVKEVHLSKRYPGRLIIHIEEETPHALVEWEGKTAGGSSAPSELYLVNEEGNAFKKVEDKDPKDFPIFTGLSRDKADMLPSLMVLLHDFESQEKLSRVGLSEINIRNEGWVTLFTKEPCFRINIGNTLWRERLNRLDLAWSDIRRTEKNIKSIDASLDKRIVVTRNGDTETAVSANEETQTSIPEKKEKLQKEKQPHLKTL